MVIFVVLHSRASIGQQEIFFGIFLSYFFVRFFFRFFFRFIFQFFFWICLSFEDQEIIFGVIITNQKAAVSICRYSIYGLKFSRVFFINIFSPLFRPLSKGDAVFLSPSIMKIYIIFEGCGDPIIYLKYK